MGGGRRKGREGREIDLKVDLKLIQGKNVVIFGLSSEAL